MQVPVDVTCAWRASCVLASVAVVVSVSARRILSYLMIMPLAIDQCAAAPLTPDPTRSQVYRHRGWRQKASELTLAGVFAKTRPEKSRVSPLLDDQLRFLA